MLGGIVGVYVVMGIYFVMGHPSPKIDYIALYNAQAVATPPEDRGWPIYRQALFQMERPVVESGRTFLKWPDFLFTYEPAKHQSQIDEWLKENTASIELLWQAADRPTMGYVILPTISPEDRPLLGYGKSVDSDSIVPMVGTSLPYLSNIRLVANLLALDAAFARKVNDARRANGNVVTLFNLSNQLHDSHSFLITDLVAIGINAVGQEQVQITLMESPDLLSDHMLAELAHRLANQKTGSDVMGFYGERLLFKDVVQHIFTDDGHGDGRITPNGLRFMSSGFGQQGSGDDQQKSRFEPSLRYALGPLALGILPSRREIIQAYDKLMDQYERALDRPLREAIISPSVASIEAGWRRSSLDLLSSIVSPSLSRTLVTAERCLGVNEGTTIAIALELYHRKHGEYPKTLAELSPMYLPQVPVDRITGGPLKYRLMDGKPLIYSVGADRDDDGGKPVTRRGKAIPDAAAEWHTAKPPPDGDWILFPQYKFEPQDNE